MMWLTRVEAERYGGLAGTGLGPLGPGLSVVLGPNEAGKSTLTALVRHVLYGFPDRRTSERSYRVEGAGRHGRLVFTDGAGEWSVERVEGTGGGSVAVRTVRGLERPELHAELIRGVGPETYRVVFGFGLAEMADIVSTSDGVVSRLYQAGAGLAMSPQEIRATLTAESQQLFTPRGRNPAINAAAREAAELAARIRELSRAAGELEAQRATLAALEDSAAGTRETARAAERRRDELAARVREIEAGEERIRETSASLVELRKELAIATGAAEQARIDARVIGAAPTIETLVAEVSAHRDRLSRVAAASSRVDALTQARADRLAEAGLDDESAALMPTGAEARARVEQARDTLIRLELRAEEAARARDAARAARDASHAAEPGVGARPRSAPAQVIWISWALIALGAAGMALGAVGTAWALVAFGALVAIAGCGLILLVRHGERDRSDATARFDADARLDAEARRTAADAEREAGALDDAREEWRVWREENGMAHVSTPVAAADVIAAAVEARRVAGERERVRLECLAESAALDSFTGRVRDLAASLGLDTETIAPGTAPETVARAADLLAQAREQERAAAAAREAHERLLPRIAALETAESGEKDRVLTALAEIGVEGGRLEAMALAEESARDAAEARERHEALERDRARVAGAIEAAETETQAGALGLDLTGVRERIAAHAERFAVLRVAIAMLAEAQAVYDRERQPAVVRDAGRVFATMTGGRYGAVSIPLGTTDVAIYDAQSKAKEIDVLSTGTAEQLYLALRIALLGTLGEIGTGLPVLMDDVFANFDPERKAGAATAVAQLARERQVIVFTCHPETCEVLTEADPGVAVFTLDRC